MLVRSAFSANIKERRDCSTALFDARGRMIAQAEHIPVHLGAMPDAVAAVRAARSRRRTRSVILNDPFAGGTHLPDMTLVSRTRSASRSPAPTTPTSARPSRAACPPARAARRGGRRDPADAARRRRRSSALVARMRNPDERRGDLRAQLAAHRLAERRRRRALRAARRGAGRGGDGRAPRLLGAPRPGGDRAAPGRALRGRRRARARGGGELRAPRRGHDRRRRARDRLRRHRRAARREPELPARRHALGLLLRRPLPHRPGRARLGRRLRAGARCARRRARS